MAVFPILYCELFVQRSFRQLPTRQRVAEHAYARFLARGSRHGGDLDDWLAAEKELFDEFFGAGSIRRNQGEPVRGSSRSAAGLETPALPREAEDFAMESV